MDFGFYLPNQDPPRAQRIVSLYEEILDMAEHGDALGFKGCVASEHHSREDGYIPSPLVLCAAIVARTKQLEASTGVMLLPLWSPIRVAEDCALIDILSGGGRFALGAGLGLVQREFDLYEIDIKTAVGRLREAIGILRKAWTGEPFSFHGSHFRLRDAQVTPAPTRPLEIRLGGQSDPAIRRAGRIGDAWLTDPLHGLETVRRWSETYRAAATEAGRPARVHLMRDCWLDEHDSDLYERWGRFLEDDWRYYYQLGSFRTGRFNPEAEPWLQHVNSADELTFDRLRRDRLLCGTVDQVREELARWIEAIRPDRINLRFRLPYGPPHSEVKEVMERFAREVMPAFTAHFGAPS
jgi:alkanesulfonate monooxygenase SsuD/methylene tetrahydromethanopterin reductase-like flavin-dependent oxidoreductase (luciferase family)